MSDQPPAPTPTPAAPVPALAQFIADVSAFRDQVATVDPASFATLGDLAAWMKSQLVDNLAELLVSLTQAVSTDVVTYVQDLGDVVARMQEEEGELLSLESAEVLTGALDLAERVCVLAAKAIPKLDQVSAAKLQKAIAAFRGQAVTAKTLIDEIVDPDEDDDGDPGDPVTAGAEPAAAAAEPAGDEPGEGG